MSYHNPKMILLIVKKDYFQEFFSEPEKPVNADISTLIGFFVSLARILQYINEEMLSKQGSGLCTAEPINFPWGKGNMVRQYLRRCGVKRFSCLIFHDKK